MGAGASAPRRMTMKNEEPHIIEVTSDVINRIKNGYQTAASSAPPPQQQERPLPPSQASQTQEIYNPRNERPEERVALSVGRNSHEVLETVSALQVRKEKDEELRANDAFWRTKLKELEARYVTSAFTSEQEFSSQLEKLRSLMPKQREAICRDISPKVADCYAANPTQVLKCSDLVKDFARCVEKNIVQGEAMLA